MFSQLANLAELILAVREKIKIGGKKFWWLKINFIFGVKNFSRILTAKFVKISTLKVFTLFFNRKTRIHQIKTFYLFEF